MAACILVICNQGGYKNLPNVTARDDYCVLLGPRIISEFSSQHCHFIDVPLTLEDTSEFQAHKIVLSLVSDHGQFIFLDCFFDIITFC